MQENTFGFAHLWASGDTISHGVAVILAIMSVISWYLVLAKAVDWWMMRRAARALWGLVVVRAALAVIQLGVPGM